MGGSTAIAIWIVIGLININMFRMEQMQGSRI
jgi:hypothetical protein